MAPSTNGSDLLARIMSAASLRARVLASNIANQNTPGYKRQDVHFEQALREELNGASAGPRTEWRPEIDSVTPARPDGNNVNLELELASLRENRILYETCAAILASHSELRRAAIESGR
jgi:flagellar basal-body rod protein FlgB